MAVLIGTSGWSDNRRVDVLHPKSASSRERLDAYARHSSTVEVNDTFYRWPRDEVFSTWRERSPDGFVFSARASRGLTQFCEFNDPIPWLERMEAGLSRLGEKRDVALYQPPPRFPINLDRLDGFLSVVPSGPKTAVEFRHPTWDVEETYAVLERHHAAYCGMSGANPPCVLRATADFVFVRLHGPDQSRRVMLG